MKTIDGDGHSGGLLTTWSRDMIFHDKSEYKDSLGTELEEPKTRTWFFFINVYGPFYDRRKYWETLSSDGAYEHANLILEGDPNLTLTAGEVWGKNACSDTLANFVSTLFEQNKLIDLQSIQLEPT